MEYEINLSTRKKIINKKSSDSIILFKNKINELEQKINFYSSNNLSNTNDKHLIDSIILLDNIIKNIDNIIISNGQINKNLKNKKNIEFEF